MSKLEIEIIALSPVIILTGTIYYTVVTPLRWIHSVVGTMIDTLAARGI